MGFQLSVIMCIGFLSSCALLLDTDLADVSATPTGSVNGNFSGAKPGSSNGQGNPAGLGGEIKEIKSLAQFLDASSPGFLGLCEQQDCPRYQFKELVVTSPEFVVQKDKETGEPKLKGVYVADPKMIDEEGRLVAFSGIKVVYFADQLESLPIGSALSFTAFAKSFYGEPQLARLQDIQSSKGKNEVLPAIFDGSLDVEDPAHPSQIRSARKSKKIGEESVKKISGGKLSKAFEGVLVTLKNVETIEPCSPHPFPFKDPKILRDFGNFRVTGEVEIGTAFEKTFSGRFPNSFEPEQTCSAREQRCGDSRVLEQAFASITGIYQKKYDQHSLEPRSTKDFAPPDLFLEESREECGTE